MDREIGRPFATRSEALSRHGMAATSQPLATLAAVDVMRAGGSAVDGAIAANAVLAVVEPTGAGLGGDLFALVWDGGEGRLQGLNASGRSPRGLSLEHLRREVGGGPIPPFGPLPLSVPGCVDGWAMLHGRFGRLPWAQLLAPAIAYASEGFLVTPVIAAHWARGGAVLRDQPGFADTFLPGKQAPASGQVFRNPGLARTLEAIAAGGRDAFYEGQVAATVGAFCRRVGGYLTADDLAAHTSTWVEPVSTTYRGARVWELPPNGQGVAALQMLNLLEPYDLVGMGFGSVDHLHHLIEAKKIAFEDRARFYADPAFADVPLDVLLSMEYANDRRKLLNPARASRTLPPGDPVLRGGDTVYLTVAGPDGTMVSLIQSNFRGFGSGLCPDGLGFCLQDRGELFALEDGHPNVYAPGKRPFHTIIPAFVTREGRPWLSFGVMGGDLQPQAHVQVLTNLLDFGMGLQEAGDAPRWHHGGSSEPTGTRMADGGTVALESGFAPDVVRDLAGRGHRIVHRGGVFGGYQAIRRDAERGTASVWAGATESRKDGCALGW